LAGEERSRGKRKGKHSVRKEERKRRAPWKKEGEGGKSKPQADTKRGGRCYFLRGGEKI